MVYPTKWRVLQKKAHLPLRFNLHHNVLEFVMEPLHLSVSMSALFEEVGHVSGVSEVMLKGAIRPYRGILRDSVKLPKIVANDPTERPQQVGVGLRDGYVGSGQRSIWLARDILHLVEDISIVTS